VLQYNTAIMKVNHADFGKNVIFFCKKIVFPKVELSWIENAAILNFWKLKKEQVQETSVCIENMKVNFLSGGGGVYFLMTGI
jgi:hypothetical protein